MTRGSFRSWLKLAVAIVLLNAGLTFGNLWPTPLVKPQWQLSIEVAVLVLGIAFWVGLSGALSKPRLRFLALFFTLLVVTHYLVVTTSGLYGRAINLYWDTQHIPRVGQMIIEAAPGWLLVVIGAGVLMLLVVTFLCSLWAISTLSHAAASRRLRGVLEGCGLAVMVLYAVANVAQLPVMSSFSPSVSVSYARQARLLSGETSGTSQRILATNSSLPPSNLKRLDGADVFILFLESYGATSFVHPPYVEALAESRTAFAGAIGASNRQVVSGFVDSPTFAGVS